MFAAALLGGVLLTGGTAFAQIGDHLLPPLDQVTEPVESVLPVPLPTSSPIQELTDPIDDTLDETGDTIGDVIGNLLGGSDPEAGDGGSGGQGGGDDGSRDGGSGGGDGSGGDGSGRDGSGNGPGSADAGDDPFGSLQPGGGMHGLSTVSAPRGYAGIAARTIVEAVERTIRMAGPLAPPLLLAAVAALGLLALGRGSDKLLKTEASRVPARTYRL